MGKPNTVIPDPRIDRVYWGKPKNEVLIALQQEIEQERMMVQFNPFGSDGLNPLHRNHLLAQIDTILKQPKSSSLSIIEQAFYFFGGNDFQKCKLDDVEFSLNELKKMVATFPDPVSSLAKKHFRLNVLFTGYKSVYTKPPNVGIAPFRTEFQFNLQWKDQRIDQSNECWTEVWWEFQGVPVTEKSEIVVIRKRGR